MSAVELNYRVRDGNGWNLKAIDTDKRYMANIKKMSYPREREGHDGDPYEIRTRVAGVRGRSLRPLDQRAM